MLSQVMHGLLEISVDPDDGDLSVDLDSPAGYVNVLEQLERFNGKQVRIEITELDSPASS